MTENVRKHWTNLLMPIFPLSAEFIHDRGGHDYELSVSWIIGTPDRPNKRSKMVRVVVSGEAESDYLGKPEEQQSTVDQRLLEFVKQQLNEFNPDHDTPSDGTPPEVRWVVSTDVLNT